METEVVDIPVVEEEVPLVAQDEAPVVVPEPVSEPVPETVEEVPVPEVVVPTPAPAPAPAPPKRATGIAGILGTVRSAGVKLSIQY